MIEFCQINFRSILDTNLLGNYNFFLIYFEAGKIHLAQILKIHSA